MPFTTLPTILAGDVPSGDNWNSILTAISEQRTRRSVCSSALTKNNNTTLSDITGCSVSLSASTTYMVRGRITVNGNGTADFKIGWTYPSGCLIYWTAEGFNTGSVYVSTNLTETSTPGFGAGNIAGTTDDVVTFEAVVVVSTTAGTLQLQGAQQTADVSNTIFRATTTYFETELRDA